MKMLGLSEFDFITLFLSFIALVYGFVGIDNWLGDKVLGTKRVIILGTLVLTAGLQPSGLVRPSGVLGLSWHGHDCRRQRPVQGQSLFLFVHLL